jgi:hypothetical protein
MNIFFAIINNGYKCFAFNFHKRWKQLKIDSKLVFICTDNICYEDLKKEGADCELVENKNLSEKFHQWQTKKYKEIVFNKLDIKKKFIEQESKKYPFVTYIDTDIWVNFNFTKELDKILKNMSKKKSDLFDIIFQDGEDYLNGTDECCDLIDGVLVKKKKCDNYCTGFMVFNSKKKEKIIELLSYKQEDIKNYSGNENFINQKITPLKMNVYTIPKIIFPNFSTSFYYKNLSEYWMLHYTYLLGKEKIYYMNRNSHWIVDEI